MYVPDKLVVCWICGIYIQQLQAHMCTAYIHVRMLSVLCMCSSSTTLRVVFVNFYWIYSVILMCVYLFNVFLC